MPPKAPFLAVCLALGSAGLSMAHHSISAYDNDHPQTVEGTVKQVNWTNPHITFVVDTAVKDGPQAGTWVFEVSSPGVLTRSGWTTLAAARRSGHVPVSAAARRKKGRLPVQGETA